jgi:hypothetical protein
VIGRCGCWQNWRVDCCCEFCGVDTGVEAMVNDIRIVGFYGLWTESRLGWLGQSWVEVRWFQGNLPTSGTVAAGVRDGGVLVGRCYDVSMRWPWIHAVVGDR